MNIHTTIPFSLKACIVPLNENLFFALGTYPPGYTGITMPPPGTFGWHTRRPHPTAGTYPPGYTGPTTTAGTEYPTEYPTDETQGTYPPGYTGITMPPPGTFGWHTRRPHPT